jgi:protein TonB
LGAYDKAISDLDTELAQTPGDARMLLARARIYRKQGKLKLALKDYSEVLKANPHAAMALRGRAAVRLKMHDYQGAIGSYRKYLNPNSADTVRMPVPVEPSEVIDLTSQAERRKTRNTIQRPRHDNPISPIYPPLARRLGEQGKVQVTFTVTTKGRVIHPDIVQSSGYFDLDIAALMTATERHYSPATRHGKPVAVRIRANFNYSLRG